MKDRLSAGAKTVVEAYQVQRKRPPTASTDVSVFAGPRRTNEDEHVWFVTDLDVERETDRADAAAVPRYSVSVSESSQSNRREDLTVPALDLVRRLLFTPGRMSRA
jgi:hypothetical protein